MPSTKFTPSSASTVLDTGGDSNIYTYGAMNYLTSLKNHLTMNLKNFMIRSIFALYPVSFARGYGRLSMATRTIASMKMRLNSSTRRNHSGA